MRILAEKIDGGIAEFLVGFAEKFKILEYKNIQVY
jgi:hypothetical protein